MIKEHVITDIIQNNYEILDEKTYVNYNGTECNLSFEIQHGKT